MAEVPSALQGLTAVFGMGTGGAPALDPSAHNSQSILLIVFDKVIADGGSNTERCAVTARPTQRVVQAI